MSQAIHTEIKNLAGGKPAAYLAVELINALTIQRALAAIKQIRGVEIPVGQRLLSARLESGVFNSKPLDTARLVKYQNALPNQIGLKLNSALSAIVKVFVKGDASKLISTVTVVASDIMLLGSYGNNVVGFEGIDFHPVTAVTRDPLADRVLMDAGIDQLEAARVEGLIAYSAINSSIGASLAQRKELSLSDFFPAFDFGTFAQMIPLNSGKALGIIPSEFTRVESAVCKCASGPDLGVSKSGDTITVPANSQAGTALGSVTIGGPLPEGINPLSDLGRRFNGSGSAGVYMPKAAYSGLTVQAMPAISVHASDDGFIGFDAHATVGFSGLKVELDVQKGGIIVSVDMDISVQATCTLDIGCGIRLPIGYAIINAASGSAAKIEMGFYPAVDGSGTVKLTGILQNVDMGKYVAAILGVGTALEIIGVTAWIGFLVDVVLSAIVSYKLPSVLRDEVKKYLGQNEWKLISGGEMLRASYPPFDKFSAPFDVDVDPIRGDTILASVSYYKV